MRDGVQISTTKREGGYKPLEIKDNAGLPTGNPSIDELLHFVECAQSGQEPLSSGYDNVNTIRFIEAMYESDRIGKMIIIDP